MGKNVPLTCRCKGLENESNTLNLQKKHYEETELDDENMNNLKTGTGYIDTAQDIT